MCGRCCRAISLDFSKRQLLALSRDETDRLRRQPHSPHRGDIERLVRDVRFMIKHFKRISRSAAVRQNPRLASTDFDGRRFYSCTLLGPDGRCGMHEGRPYVCEGYPWYYGQPSRDLLVVTACGYEDDVMD